jgi:signal transduction histidine kinase
LPLRNVDGRIVGIVGIGHDITKRKKTELLNEALFKISETSYTASDMHALYKNIHEVIKTLMPANNFYIAQYDDKADLLSFPYFIDEHDSPPIPRKPGNRLTEYVLRNGEAILVDAMKALELKQSGKVVLSKSPIPIWLGVPLKIEGKVIGVIVLCDYENENVYSEDEMQLLIFVSNQVAQVIERKKNSEAIQTYIEELRLLNQTKDKFFSIIAHDLKNPFITILGFCDLLLSDFTELSVDEMLFFIQEMKNSANLNHNLLQNLLLWSRSQTGRLEFSPRKLELLDIINENFLLLNKTSEKKQIRLHHEIPFALHVTADEDMLNTVLRNLLTNAIKFSNKGSIISVKAVANDNFVEICVADSGIGMDQKKIDNLFRLDAAHSTAGTENELGTGLGLILCKEFIEKNGGKIWVESEIGKGSKFNFSLLS